MKVVKPVAFNPTKENEALMLKYVKRRNFSGYVKKLIWQDIERRNAEKAHSEQNKDNEEHTTSTKQKTAAQKLQELKQKRPGSNPGPQLFTK